LRRAAAWMRAWASSVSSAFHTSVGNSDRTVELPMGLSSGMGSPPSRIAPMRKVLDSRKALLEE
jgi:hypothetical protein